MAAVDINALVSAAGIDENQSKKWMVYTSDTEQAYAVNISESIGEAMGFGDITTANETLPQLPKTLSMRRVNAVSANGKVRASYPVADTSQDIFLEGGTITVPRKGYTTGLVLAVTGVIGETRRLVGSPDSGQDSGDLT